MGNAAHILVVDDDAITRDCLACYFEEEGYNVLSAETAEEAEEYLLMNPVDLVLLDIRLPGKDGLTLTRELRVKSELGIILVTGRQDDIERIIGLECGADDYISKPFQTRELLARAKNLIRRVKLCRASARHDEPRSSLKAFEGWTLDIDRRELSGGDKPPTQLTEGEFQLLIALLENAGHTMSRDRLMDKIRNREWTPSDRTIDVLVGRLRKKLLDDPTNPSLIRTVHGAGYLFTAKAVDL